MDLQRKGRAQEPNRVSIARRNRGTPEGLPRDAAANDPKDHPMKLYYHPVSVTSRPVMLFLAENNIACDLQLIDLATGEHYGDAFTSVNPNRLVPVLDDDGFALTESSAILKYLAEKI